MIFRKEKYKTKVADASDENDIALWNNLRGGSQQAFAILYHRHADDLYNYGMHIFMDKPLVEDAIQDLFLDLWRRKDFLGETTSVKFYLYRSLKRSVVKKIRINARADKQSVVVNMLAQKVVESAESQRINSEVLVQCTEVLERAISFLPERQREIIIYRFYQDLSPGEISTRMSLSIDSTYTLLSRAIHTLRKFIKERPALDHPLYWMSLLLCAA